MDDFDEYIDDYPAVLILLLLKVISIHPSTIDKYLTPNNIDFIRQFDNYLEDKRIAPLISAYIMVSSFGRLDRQIISSLLSDNSAFDTRKESQLIHAAHKGDTKAMIKLGDFYYYGVFGADMPDLNYNNPDVRQAAKDAAGHWLELGLDGFRMDAAVHIYGAHEFKQQEDSEAANINWWNEFAGYCESINPDVYLVGEVWQDDKVLENYVQPFNTKFDFAIQQKILNCVQKGMAVPGFGDSLSVAIENIQNKYDGVDVNYLNGVFGANHDQDRIASSVNSLDKARQIAAVYMTLPGNPYIYYGEELGMYGSKPDEMIRTPFLWGDDSTYNTSWEKDDQNAETKGLDQQMKDPDSMYSYYKTLIALRKDNPALMKGNYRAAALTNDSVIAYFREADGQKLLVVHNFAEGDQTVSLAECGDITVTNVLYSSSGETGVSDFSSVKLAGNESVVLELGE